MNTLSIDIETYSSNDLKKGGVYKYIEAEDFEIMLFAYKLNDNPTIVLDLTDGRGLPDDVLDMLYKDNYEKTAWNAAFEIACLNKYLKRPLLIHQWRCTMIKASMLGLPMTLAQAGSVLRLAIQKDKMGDILIRYFCIPCKPTEKNRQRTRNFPSDDWEKWTQFKKYNGQDVDAEHAIANEIAFFNVPDQEQELWQLDQEINARGVLTDPDLIHRILAIDLENNTSLIEECIRITGIQNPRSRNQLLKWLQEEMPLEDDMDTLTKADIPPMLAKAIGYSNEANIKRVLEIRQDLSKTSIRKYQAMVNARNKDNRIRGLFQFYGANRTGRWAGRIVQMHNLPKTNMEGLDLARRVVKCGKLEWIHMLMPFIDEDGNPLNSVPAVLSQLIRTSFIPKPGHKFIVVDSSAIEARIIAWLSKEEWRLEVFKTHGKIYEASASRMFNIPFDQVTKEDRAKGKVAELALGYQGGAGAMRRMDNKHKIESLAKKKYAKIPAEAWELLESDEPMTEEDFIDWSYQDIVNKWRPANPAITRMWKDLQQAAIEVVRDRCRKHLYHVDMFVERGVFFIQLPSGRRLSYLKPVIKTKIVKPEKGDPFEVEGVAYLGVDQDTKHWGYQHTYGGKITENICQAIARDCLGYWLKTLGYQFTIVAHVHDEIVIEAPADFAELGLKHAIDCMSREIPWAPGLPLAAAGFVTDYYKKD